MQYVIGLGEALFDCLPTGRKLGGAPANFAFHASRFGLNSCAVSAIGNDELGREIIDILTSAGLGRAVSLLALLSKYGCKLNSPPLSQFQEAAFIQSCQKAQRLESS